MRTLPRLYVSLWLVLVAVMSHLVAAAEPKIIITTRPTTAPSPLTAEQLEIKQVIVEFARSIARGDAPAAQAMYAGDNAVARTVIMSYVQAVEVHKQLEDAVRERFGDAAVEQLPAAGPVRFANACEKIQNVQIGGDTALVDRKHLLDPFKLQRSAGAWRIVGLPQAFSDAELPGKISEELDVYRQIAAETREGPFTDAVAVKRAMQERIFALKQAREVKEQSPATTTPAAIGQDASTTQPAAAGS